MSEIYVNYIKIGDAGGTFEIPFFLSHKIYFPYSTHFPSSSDFIFFIVKNSSSTFLLFIIVRVLQMLEIALAIYSPFDLSFVFVQY
jgi:hypothetical protein